MASSPLSSSTLAGSSPPPGSVSRSLDLSILPPIFVLPTHLSPDDLHDIEDQIHDHDGLLTYDITEAKVVIGKVGTKRRAEFELRSRKLWTEELAMPTTKPPAGISDEGPPRKRPRLDSPSRNSRGKEKAQVPDDSETESEAGSEPGDPAAPAARTISSNATLSPSPERGATAEVVPASDAPEPEPASEVPFSASDFLNQVKVVKMDWLEESFNSRRILSLDPYTIYVGRPIARPIQDSSPPRTSLNRQTTAVASPTSRHTLAERPQTAQDILARAQADAGLSHYAPARDKKRFHPRSSGFPSSSQTDSSQTHPTKLLQQTTSEYEGTDTDIPEPPSWVKRRLKYACQRSTPAHSPNNDFIDQLKEIRLFRTLTGDEIGVRAYSTSIASLAAYPYRLTSPREIMSLPGCDVKIANLWIEYTNTGQLSIVNEHNADSRLQGLKLFYDIWGVGAPTAREFYDKNGWREIDDVVEYGWSGLNRVQQIGVKYYDEFKIPIPRPEVEQIADVVKEHAIRVRDFGVEVCVVGGYRRGKAASGDVDLIVSHRRLDATANLVTDVVSSLETEGWITHTLTLHTTGTERGQSTLPYRARGTGHGPGFDTLDKALVVWQDPSWPSCDADLAKNPKAKNPNIHRRVDIIVSPWRTVGCAVCGWSGGTTFQRDLRRYAGNVKGWKFDSSGIRNRATGEVVALEGPDGVEEGKGMEDAERKVFEGMGLEYRAPWERCTG